MNKYEFESTVNNYLGYIDDLRNLLKSEGHADGVKTLGAIFDFIFNLEFPKFDVLEYMKNGSKVIATNGDVYYFKKKVLLSVLPGSGRFDHFALACQPDLNIFFGGLLGDSLRPYTDPEPTPQEILEKARDALDGGQQDHDDGVAIEAALDHLEKLISE